MIEIQCSICGKIFSSDKKEPGPAKLGITEKFKNHLKNDHNITLEQYLINTYYNGVHPKCACGCGKELKFHKKNALYNEGHGFGKFYHCSHVNHGKYKFRPRRNDDYINKYENLEWCKKHYDDLYGWDNIIKALEDYRTREYNNIDIRLKYNIDIRTLKKIWIKFSLITEEELYDIRIYNKYKLSAKRRKIILEDADIICGQLFELIKNYPLEYNISSLIKFYNDNNVKPIETDHFIILHKMENLYGNEIYEYLQYGYHSKEEVDFIKILKFYFSKKKVLVGKSLQYGDSKSLSYIYDVCIDNKILIEYDSTGIWHKDTQRDKEKELFALKSGYKFMRVSLDQSKNPELILNIKKLLEK